MRKIILVTFLFCSLVFHAQNNAIQQAVKNYDFETAIRLIAKEKRTPELDFLKARCYKNLARYQEAIAVLEELVNQDKTDLSALTELAGCYQLSGNLRKAKYFYSIALVQVPNNRFVQLNYLDVLCKLKEWNQSIKLAHSILKTDSLICVLPVMGDCYLQLSNPDSAICYYRKALDANSEDYLTLSKLSKIYMQSANYEELVCSTGQYMRTDSTNQVINQYNGIGHCLSQNYDQSIYRLGKLFQEGDSSYSTNYYLGVSYFAKKDFISAYVHLKMAYQKDTTNQNLYLYLGKSAVNSGHAREGIDVLKKGLDRLIPKDSVLFTYHYNISLGYNNCGRPADEVSSLKQAFKYNPQYALFLYTIGYTYDWKLKNPEAALEYYNQFLATKPRTKDQSDEKASSTAYYVVAENRANAIKAELAKGKRK